MSLRNWTPCDEPDLEGHHHCPYADDGDYVNCEYWCGAEEPQDDPYIWEEDEEEEPTYEEEIEDDEENSCSTCREECVGCSRETICELLGNCPSSRDDWDEPSNLDMGFDPYMGCYTDDC